MDPELRNIEGIIKNLDITSNESVLNFQKKVNAYTNDSTGIGMYPDRDLLKEDGIYGGHSRTRLGRMKEFINDRRADSLFDANEKAKKDFYRDYMWTIPEDTLGVQGAKKYRATEMLKAKTKEYNKGSR